jgi:putative DNA primase/helicase
VIFAASRPLVINGIEDLATRGDLADRAVVVHLASISLEQRESARQLWARFDVALPGILGGLLDAVSGALARIDQVDLPQTPRMADAAIWITAAEEVLGWESGSFVAALAVNRDETLDQSLDAHPLAATVRGFMTGRLAWRGTASDLLKEPGFKDLGLTASLLGSQLRRLAPALAGRGLVVEFERERGSRVIQFRSVTASPD